MFLERHTDSIVYRVSGAGAPVLLLHGFPADGSVWDDVAQILSTKFRVLVPDLPGSGKSACASTPSIDAMAFAVLQLLDEECLNNATWVGHSMGGYVALAAARMQPERFAGLSLVHSTPDADDAAKISVREKSIDLIQNGGKTPFIRQTVANLFAPDFKLSQSEIVEKLIDTCAQTGEAALINFYRAMIGRADSNDLAIFKHKPTQYVLGKQDNLLDYRKLLTKAISPNICFLTLMQDCGHMSMIENSELLASELKKFIEYCNADS